MPHYTDDPPRRVGDVPVSSGEVLREQLRTRPVQFLAKAIAAAIPGFNETPMPFPVGGGEWTHKTPIERLDFELGLARQEVQGRRLEEQIRADRQERNMPHEDQGVGQMFNPFRRKDPIEQEQPDTYFKPLPYRGPNGYRILEAPNGKRYEVLPGDFQGTPDQAEGVVSIRETHFTPRMDMEQYGGFNRDELSDRINAVTPEPPGRPAERGRPDLSGLNEVPGNLARAAFGALPEETQRGFRAFPRVAAQEGAEGTARGLIGSLASAGKEKLVSFINTLREGAHVAGEFIDDLRAERSDFAGETGSEMDLSDFQGIVPHTRSDSTRTR